MRAPLKVLDLFSGIGGFSLGLERTGGFKTVAFCEIEEYPRRVLAKHWPGVPIHRDVRELRAEHVGAIDVICGGYPCQPFSVAGDRRGQADDRHLWPEMARLVAECRPAWLIGENVAGHIDMGLDDVLSDLEAMHYAARAFVIPACAVGAPHERTRLWIVAHSDGLRSQRRTITSCVGQGGSERSEQSARLVPSSFWLDISEAGLRGEDDGLPSKLHRLRALGNAVVPQIPEIIGRAILEAEGRLMEAA